jgi:hypothetical protein
MTITIQAHDIVAQLPISVAMTDSSGSHVELILLIGTLEPIRHAFAFTEGTITIPLPDLKPGKYKCTFVVQAFKTKATPNRMYNVALDINGSSVARCKGNIPQDRSNDFGFADFELTVREAP